MNIRIIEEIEMNGQSIRREVEIVDIAGTVSAEELSHFIADVVERVSKVIGSSEAKQ